MLAGLLLPDQSLRAGQVIFRWQASDTVSRLARPQSGNCIHGRVCPVSAHPLPKRAVDTSPVEIRPFGDRVYTISHLMIVKKEVPLLCNAPARGYSGP